MAVSLLGGSGYHLSPRGRMRIRMHDCRRLTPKEESESRIIGSNLESSPAESRFRWRCHLLLFEYAIRIEEWNDSIQEKGAGGLDFHLGH